MTRQKQPVARKPFLIAVATAGVFTIILSFPKRNAIEPQSTFENPQQRAEELINGLLVRFGTDPVDLPVTPPATPDPGAPGRDLFNTVRVEAAVRSAPNPEATRSARRVRMPALPDLGGLLVDGEQRLAILDGTAIGEGETIGPFTVRSIEDDGVVLEWRGQTKRVRWKE